MYIISLSCPRHLVKTSPGCLSVTVPPSGAGSGKSQWTAITFDPFNVLLQKIGYMPLLTLFTLHVCRWE